MHYSKSELVINALLDRSACLAFNTIPDTRRDVIEKALILIKGSLPSTDSYNLVLNSTKVSIDDSNPDESAELFIQEFTNQYLRLAHMLFTCRKLEPTSLERSIYSLCYSLSLFDADVMIEYCPFDEDLVINENIDLRGWVTVALMSISGDSTTRKVNAMHGHSDIAFISEQIKFMELYG